ncbi:MAG TPA: NAD-dependent malic enzyme [Thermodesulfobacteriota bacterium]|nr:NAD-dependent malic enzyme [Thermodesulfobacteriota bacterium]
MTIRVVLEDVPGTLGRLTSRIGELGGNIGAIDLVQAGDGTVTRDITVNTRDEAHARALLEGIQRVKGVTLLHASDRTFLMHLGGKIEVVGKYPVKTRDDLSQVYTPGVARVCLAIAEDPSRAAALTIKKNTVAVVSDGSAVLGLGDIGPDAAMPVMEGKAMIFKAFGGVDAFPIVLRTRDVDEIVRTVVNVSTAFGGINLEDIAAPRCFEIEEKLQAALDIPVFHDDQHGTAVVVLAALINALKIVKKKLKEVRIVISGVGAAGVACARLLRKAGAGEIIGVDRAGIIYPGRPENMNPAKEAFAQITNPRRLKGTLADALKRADVLLGLSGPRTVTPKMIRTMARDPIVFAMANPVPEIMPEECEGLVRVMATGRSDYPNQINNSLCFPGFFRGLLDARARCVNDEMKIAAARAIAELVSRRELSEEYIVPSMFDQRVAPAVAEAVRRAAVETKVARRQPKTALAFGAAAVA